MSLTGIFIATAVVGGIGVILGILLGIAAIVFKVDVDEIEMQIREVLPGNNCGGCGFAGCDALAGAIAAGEASAAACPVGGAVVADKIAEITGTSGEVAKNVAFIKCAGDCDKAKIRYEYSGNSSCKEAVYVTGGGAKSCTFGCLGYGSCLNACEFGAIKLIDGLAVVDKEKCVACGRCIDECPKNLIELVPWEAKHLVRCISTNKGKEVKAVCAIGCIACRLCEKACEFDAVKVENNYAKIDYGKCTNCGACAQKCPTKVII